MKNIPTTITGTKEQHRFPLPASGFCAAGYYDSGGSAVETNEVERYCFITEENAVLARDTGIACIRCVGVSSNIDGFVVGGYSSHTHGDLALVDRYSYNVDSWALGSYNLSRGKEALAGHQSLDYGFVSGGLGEGDTFKTIEKFSFAVYDGSIALYGDLTFKTKGPSGQSSSDYGYTTSGYSPENGGKIKSIQKFNFNVEEAANIVGDITKERMDSAGHQSATHGFTSGGNAGAISIEKFSFTNEGTAETIGDLTAPVENVCGESSPTHGYASGGWWQMVGTYSHVSKFSFSTNGNATDICDLTRGKAASAGMSFN